MRSLPRRVSAAAVVAALPGLAAAQQAATGSSVWNWIIGLAALVVVLAIAWDLFGPAGRRRRAGEPPRAR